MKKVVLQPNQVIAPGELYLHSEQILRIYYHILAQDKGELLPPAIVVANDPNFTVQMRDSYLTMVKALSDSDYVQLPFGPPFNKKGAIDYIPRTFKAYQEKCSGASHHLLDGNHRMVAATLAHQPLYGLELESDQDLSEVRNMIDRGELLNFFRNERTLLDLLHNLTDYNLNNLTEVSNFEQRVKELVETDTLPKYMVDNFLKER